MTTSLHYRDGMDDADRTHIAELVSAWRHMSGRLDNALSDATRSAYWRLERAAWEEYMAAADKLDKCRDVDCWDAPAEGLAHCALHGKR